MMPLMPLFQRLQASLLPISHTRKTNCGMSDVSARALSSGSVVRARRSDSDHRPPRYLHLRLFYQVLEALVSTTLPVTARPFTRTEFRCEGCGRMVRVDCEFWGGPIVGREAEYQHCPDDKLRHVEGPILVVWEKLDGSWIPKSTEG